MINGLDTTFLVEVDILEHPNHQTARSQLVQMTSSGHRFALAPQVLSEYIHVVTDPRRFEKPLSTAQSIDRAVHWWQSTEVTQVFPNAETVSLFKRWMITYHLGRKRILDTMLAATYLSNGVSAILSSNARDYQVFNEIQCIHSANE
ncbi:MAG: PIN domain-containing protein [Deltaproteobacteria bacterium]|nr:PIN domain-containing protein [Deltaproteobacteria bacterium]MBN2673385.1 PIN domain-containing protein [Deltaproteobacteria bacterium]